MISRWLSYPEQYCCEFYSQYWNILLNLEKVSKDRSFHFSTKKPFSNEIDQQQFVPNHFQVDELKFYWLLYHCNPFNLPEWIMVPLMTFSEEISPVEDPAMKRIGFKSLVFFRFFTEIKFDQSSSTISSSHSSEKDVTVTHGEFGTPSNLEIIWGGPFANSKSATP